MNRIMRHVATLTDSKWIRSILDAVLIPSPGVVHRADVVDITVDGFGPDDLILLSLFMDTYLVRENVLRMMQDAIKS